MTRIPRLADDGCGRRQPAIHRLPVAPTPSRESRPDLAAEVPGKADEKSGGFPAWYQDPRPGPGRKVLEVLAVEHFEISELDIVHIHDEATHADSSEGCCKGAVALMSEDHEPRGWVPTFCRNWRCKRCAPRLRAMWAYRIMAFKPERFITLTCNPKLYQDPAHAYAVMKRGVVLLIARLRRLGYLAGYVLAWEACKSGWPHIHIGQVGRYIPQGLLKRLWTKYTGSCIVHIEGTGSEKKLAWYIAKYLAKVEAWASFIPRGHRIITTSKNFPKLKVVPLEGPLFSGCHGVHTRRRSPEILMRLLNHHDTVAAWDCDQGMYVVRPRGHPWTKREISDFNCWLRNLGGG